MSKPLRWCALAMLAVAACGGDDDSNGGGTVTGLPSQQKLSTLSDADVKKACQSVNDRAATVFTTEALARAFCVPFGVQEAVSYANDEVVIDVNKCQEFVDTCVSSAEEEADPNEPTGGDVNDCGEASAEDLAGCDATVAEYEACIDKVFSETKRRLSELTCQNAEEISSEEYQNDELDPAKIPECQTVMAKCPDSELGIPSTE